MARPDDRMSNQAFDEGSRGESDIGKVLHMVDVLKHVTVALLDDDSASARREQVQFRIPSGKAFEVGSTLTQKSKVCRVQVECPSPSVEECGLNTSDNGYSVEGLHSHRHMVLLGSLE